MVNIREIKRKICLIGDGGVGKTSLIQRFVLDQFDDKYIATFGSKVTKKRIKFRKDENNIIDVFLLVWDLMGQIEFKKARKLAYQGTQAALIVCDITSKESLLNITNWRGELFDATGEIPIIILANKIDLKAEAEFSPTDLKEQNED